MASPRYQYRHQQKRKQWQPKVEAGNVNCHATICLMPTRWIQPGTPWDLGHNTNGTAWTGPEHPLCNRSEGGKRAHKPASTPHSRDW